MGCVFLCIYMYFLCLDFHRLCLPKSLMCANIFDVHSLQVCSSGRYSTNRTLMMIMLFVDMPCTMETNQQDWSVWK